MNDNLILSILNLLLNGTTWPYTSGTLYVSLHTANPGASGHQNTSEAAYTSYARVAVSVTSGAWTVSAETFSPANPITFPTATGGSETETYAGLGTAATGAGTLLWAGPISPNLTVSNGITPQLLTSSTATIT